MSRSEPNNAPYISSRHYPIPSEVMPPGDAKRLALEYQQHGDERCISRIVMGNMAGIRALCSRPEYRLPGVDVEDLIQEAAIGYIKGVKRYEPDKKTTVNSYAHYWAEKAVREFVQWHGHTVRVTDNGHRAYSVMMRRHEIAVREWETDRVPHDSVFLANERPKCEVAGALTVLTRSYADPHTVQVSNNAPANDHGDTERVIIAAQSLPEPQRSMVFAYFGLEGRKMKKEMKRNGWSADEVERIVSGCIDKMRRSLSYNEAPRASTPNPRARIFPKSHQTALFDPAGRPAR